MKVRVDSWAWLPKAELTPDQIVRLKDTLTVRPVSTSPQQEEPPEPIPLYRDEGEFLGIARAYFFAHRRPVHQVEYAFTKGRGDLWHPAEFAGQLRAEQDAALREVSRRFEAGQFGGIIQAKPGWGKCLAPETPVLRYDGEIVRAEEVREGDQLMGPDSAPRRVLSTTRGIGKLYRVVPKVGESWVCNDAHILTLVHSITGEVLDIAIEDYLALPASKKHYLKQFSPPDGVDFASSGTRLLDPYFLGVWYADGTKALNGVAISKPDAEIVAMCASVAREYGLRVRTEISPSGGCPTHHLVGEGGSNPLLDQLRETVGDGEVFPSAYLTAPRGVRLRFLAGFLDGDGHNNNGCLRVVQKRRGYAEGAAFLARSLGIRATIREKRVNGEAYWRVNMAGDFSELPMRIARKWPGKRRQKKIATRTGFAVEPVGVGDYAGFTLSGDGRFLLGDFTVTHNTVCALAIAAHMKVPTLVVVHKEFLMDQWIERIEKFLPEARVGRVQQDECDFRGRTIVLGMVHSVAKRQYPSDFYEWPGLVITDECHRIGARTWSEAPPQFAAKYRLGFTATPRRKDGAEGVFFGHIGPVMFAGKEQRLTPQIKRVWSKFKLVKTDRFNPNLANRTLLLRFLCASNHRNDMIVDQLIAALTAGRKCIVLSERLKHLAKLEQRLQEMWPSEYGEAPSTGWYVGGKKKHELEESAQARVVFATSQYAAEGLDIPALDTMFLTTPMSDVEQAVGRIQRPYKGKKSPIVVDIRDDSIPMFEAQGRKRDRFYSRLT